VYPPAQRTLDILELLSEAPTGLALSTIGARLTLPKSAAHRLLSGLCERGFVEQLAGNQYYALTLKLASLGLRHLASTRLEEIGQPVLDRLARHTGELARLAVVDGERMTWVAKAQGTLSGLRYDPDTGRDVVLHATAVGKAWLASLPEARALAIAQRAGFGDLERRGPRVARNVGMLRTRLRETRRRGYGEAVDEGEPGVAAVAATIRASAAPDAPVVGTVSIAGPLARMDAPRRASLARDVLAAAADLTRYWPLREQHRRATAPVSTSQPEHADVH
jgi:DNA-binding IclR family transcriptional regulator